MCQWIIMSFWTYRPLYLQQGWHIPWKVLEFDCCLIFMPLPLGARGFMFSSCLSVCSKPETGLGSIPFLAATKQLYEWFSPSVRLSVCPSVCLSVTPFWLCYHHRIIMKFSGVITKDQGKVHAKGQGQRSKVKVTEVTTQLNRFRTVTPVWIHIWWWNDAYSLIMLRRGALLFFKVIRKIWRSHGSKNRRIWPRLGVSGL